VTVIVAESHTRRAVFGASQRRPGRLACELLKPCVVHIRTISATWVLISMTASCATTAESDRSNGDGKNDGYDRDPATCSALPSTGVLAKFNVNGEVFAASITNPLGIDEALAIWDGTGTATVPNGEIVCSKQGWNCPYDWHLDPGTLRFAEFVPEVCDGRPMSDVDCEFALGRYCPWGAEMIELRDCRTDPTCPAIPRSPATCGHLPSAGLLATFEVNGELFTASITNKFGIDEALAVWAGTATANIPNGEIVCSRQGWNCPYDWHLDPSTLRFAELVPEVCDGRPMSDVNCEFGNGRFCPWAADMIELRDCRTESHCPPVPRN
jgi:hypothetical protein